MGGQPDEDGAKSGNLSANATTADSAGNTSSMATLFSAAKFTLAAARVQEAYRRLRSTRLIRQWFHIIERAKQQVHLRNKAAKTRSKLAFVKQTMHEQPSTDEEEAARMFQLSSNLLNTLVCMQDEGEVKLVVDGDEAQTLDITKQGNADHYTSNAVRNRKRLSYDARIRAITHMFWLIAVQDKRDATSIDYDAYSTVFARITKALVPDFDRSQAENMLASDWEADNGGFPAPAGSMTKEQLHVALFELVDTWVDVVDATAYVQWLYALLWSISRVEDGPYFSADGQIALKSFDEILYMLDEEGEPIVNSGTGGESYAIFEQLCEHLVQNKLVKKSKMPAELLLDGEDPDSSEDEEEEHRRSVRTKSVIRELNKARQASGQDDHDRLRAHSPHDGLGAHFTQMGSKTAHAASGSSQPPHHGTTLGSGTANAVVVPGVTRTAKGSNSTLARTSARADSNPDVIDNGGGSQSAGHRLASEVERTSQNHRSASQTTQHGVVENDEAGNGGAHAISRLDVKRRSHGKARAAEDTNATSYVMASCCNCQSPFFFDVRLYPNAVVRRCHSNQENSPRGNAVARASRLDRLATPRTQHTPRHVDAAALPRMHCFSLFFFFFRFFVVFIQTLRRSGTGRDPVTFLLAHHQMPCGAREDLHLPIVLAQEIQVAAAGGNLKSSDDARRSSANASESRQAESSRPK